MYFQKKISSSTIFFFKKFCYVSGGIDIRAPTDYYNPKHKLITHTHETHWCYPTRLDRRFRLQPVASGRRRLCCDCRDLSIDDVFPF